MLQQFMELQLCITSVNAALHQPHKYQLEAPVGFHSDLDDRVLQLISRQTSTSNFNKNQEQSFT